MDTKKKRIISNEDRQQIVVDVSHEFSCFGDGLASPNNPLGEWLTGPPVFALGVDVRQVVDYVLSRVEDQL